jgi:hypothetical protein
VGIMPIIMRSIMVSWFMGFIRFRGFKSLEGLRV